MRLLSSFISALVFAVLLSACAAPPPGDVTGSLSLAPGPSTARNHAAGCCRSLERFPDWLVGIAENQIDLTRAIGTIELRPGHLGRTPVARSHVEQALRPLDIVMVHSEGRVSGHLIPGQFTHGAVYLGSEAQLRAAGLWSTPALIPYHEQISAGDVFLEAVDEGVVLSSVDVVLNTDATVILRPRLTRSGARAALSRGVARMGTPFDMLFDTSSTDELFCVELIEIMYQNLNLPSLVAYDTQTIIPDVIVAGSLLGEVPFDLVGYVEVNARGGARALSAEGLAARIGGAWPPQPDSPAPYPQHLGAVP